MPGNDALRALRWLSRSSGGLLSGSEATTQQCLSKTFSRSVSSETQTASNNSASRPIWTPAPAKATTYSFPSMEPLRFVEYPQNHLLVPLRKDLLHRAVVYEGDMTRQGTASTKWRDEVHASHRKIQAQKGSGRARVGDKTSPIRKGGGVAHGPHPRDFSSGLPRKVYDQAWRIALSYRYRRGQLIIIDNEIALPEGATSHLVSEIFKANGWGREFGRSTLITERVDEQLFETVRNLSNHAKILDRQDVDVKDILETGRLIIEKKALDTLLAQHSRDLNAKVAKALY
ncbi:54S ribosomal protein yml6, mitochondrial [Aspergillus melleus]|uniref:54S ribosomal protein yml6, mitochondrial n=1 Tax=Aspergillus melleus TaxID=138277 RepID=A0ACC3ASR7_9EURO|nr:54S ribosomal protein yml6, mitochondrial [Aspergillus melleus]